jgi:hypothetical protein
MLALDKLRSRQAKRLAQLKQPVAEGIQAVSLRPSLPAYAREKECLKNELSRSIVAVLRHVALFGAVLGVVSAPN